MKIEEKVQKMTDKEIREDLKSRDKQLLVEELRYAGTIENKEERADLMEAREEEEKLRLDEKEERKEVRAEKIEEIKEVLEEEKEKIEKEIHKLI